jgi:uncharacterized membrane protein
MAQRDSEHPEHLREAGETIQELREERHQSLPKRERVVRAIVTRIGRPRFLMYVVAFIVAWVALNLVLRPYHRAFDSDTFALLNTIAQLVSLVVVLTILSGQNSERTLEEERDRLTLQMSLIIDKKITEALRQLSTSAQQHELREPTDLHQAAEVLRKAEEQIGKDTEQRAGGDGE